jgi:hypothetical protein
LDGPTGIIIQWDWVGPGILLVALGLAGPPTINCNQFGWAQ